MTMMSTVGSRSGRQIHLKLCRASGSSRAERAATREVNAVALALVEKDLALVQVDDLRQSGLDEPASHLFPGMAREITGGVPVERVADPHLGVGMHRHADRQEVKS